MSISDGQRLLRPGGGPFQMGEPVTAPVWPSPPVLLHFSPALVPDGEAEGQGPWGWLEGPLLAGGAALCSW